MLNLTLTPRQLCDFELIQNGGFAPLRSFMNRAEYESVCSQLTLPGGSVFPMPIVLDVTEEVAKKLKAGDRVALQDPEGVTLGILTVSEMWEPKREHEAEAVFGTTNREHPGVNALLGRTNPIYLSGALEFQKTPTHYDFSELRFTPEQLKAQFAEREWKRVVAFQTRNPLHRAHYELMVTAAKRVDGKLLLHPVVGMTRPGDVDHFTRVRAYRAIMQQIPKQDGMLSLLNLAMRMGGPREAVWHAVIRKNHGCTHFIVGRDHAGPGKDSSGKPFYGPYDAQTLVKEYADRIGIEPVFSKEMFYVKDLDKYFAEDELPSGKEPTRISATEFRKMLDEGREVPAWFSFPSVVREVVRTHRPRSQQGLTVFFTGLPSSGKSTIANVLISKLLEIGGRQVTLLDGDLVRKHLSSELGFSKEHRDLNIRRIGYVASEITKHGGIAICAPIAPFDQTRKDVREMIAPLGGFFLVHVATPLEECERRDRKGLYAKARKGEIAQFTGVSDPYEAPQDAEITLDTIRLSPLEAAEEVIRRLQESGYLESRQ